MRVIEPELITGLLRNPGTGFFAAPALEDPENQALTEPLYRFTPDSPAYNHPDSGVAFVSSRWSKAEPREGVYDWSGILANLEAAGAKGRTCVLRVAPYALGNDDVPAWLRARNPKRPDFPFWQVDPNDSDYAPCWARFVRALAHQLDGHPFLSSVDMALVGAWGEGGGTEFMKRDKLAPIVDAYMDNFRKTPLQCLLHDPASLAYIRQKDRPVGFRVDCLGDMGGFHGKRWNHMEDFYPQNIENFGMGEAWKKAPVVFEACWTMRDWFNNGWDVEYIIGESLKWHISSFNSKGCPVPGAWQGAVADWVSKMGYRLELRRIVVPEQVRPGSGACIQMLWRNSGVAPCYHPFQVVCRLRGTGQAVHFIPCEADVREWLPGEDHIVADWLTADALPPGEYALDVGILTGISGIRPIALGTRTEADGFTRAGTIRIMEDD